MHGTRTVAAVFALVFAGLLSFGCDSSKDTANGVTERVEKGLEGSRKALEKAADKTGQLAGAAGEQTQNGLDQSRKALEKAAEKTGEALVVASEKTKEGLEKAGEEITDAWILGRVKAGFIGVELLKGSEIDVDCSSHVVTLKGSVASAAARDRAVGIARDVTGVSNVVDHLKVGPKS